MLELWWLLPGTAFGLWFSVYLLIRCGGTPGRLLLGTRVVMQDGSPITPRAALIRHAVTFVLSLLALQIWVWAEVVTVLFNKKRRAIHDSMAGTAVVRLK